MHVKHLGKKSAYIEHYTASLLEPIPRSLGRNNIGLTGDLPFSGCDLWTGFELSWLNAKGKPMVGIAEFIIPASSQNLIESKSFKLYLNSFNQTRINSPEELHALLTNDLSAAVAGEVTVRLFPAMLGYTRHITAPPGINIDSLDITVDDYHFDANWLQNAVDHSAQQITETLNSNLLKSNCLVTYQPDWGSVIISYQGLPIDKEKLLRYLISFRQHNEFHEQCVERIFMDIKQYCQPDKLTVFARYTRRGGLDINPFRSDYETELPCGRLIRQ